MYFSKLDEAIAAYLRRAGKTQAALADELGMSDNSLSWKRRGIREFSLSEAARLADIIGCDLDDVVMPDYRASKEAS